MSARVGVLTFPGSNSEVETVRALRAAGIKTELVHWSADITAVRAFDAYVLPGGFAYEDRVRAGAIAAHDRLMEAVREGADSGKLVLGICNGAQILLEAGLAPGIDLAPGTRARAQASFTHNENGAFICRHTHVVFGPGTVNCAITAALPQDAIIPMWASHGEGRLAAHPDVLEKITSKNLVAFVYADASGTPITAPNGSALNAAAITNEKGNVLAIMPHAERNAWLFQQPWSAERRAMRGKREAIMEPAGASVFFEAFAAALKQG
jgi:phosphoribosylformylglycinamidine synthase I